MDRVAFLEQFISQNPQDPFPRYGLALELVARDERARAREIFAQLVDRFPSYLATYLMAGNNLAVLGEASEARALYEQGLRVAGEAGDDHTRGELSAALVELGDPG